MFGNSQRTDTGIELRAYSIALGVEIVVAWHESNSIKFLMNIFGYDRRISAGEFLTHIHV